MWLRWERDLNTSSGDPPPTPDFTLAASPTNSSVTVGTSVSVSLSATAVNGFSSQISVQVTGLPTRSFHIAGKHHSHSRHSTAGYRIRSNDRSHDEWNNHVHWYIWFLDP